MPKKNIISLIVVISVIFTIGYIELAQKMWRREHRVIFWDVKSYYAYLPSIVIHQDPLFEFVDKNPEAYGDKFWLETAENGNKVILTSMGLALLYLPFFILGHISAHILDLQATGYSPPYFFFMLLGSLFYVSVGFIFLRKVLLRFFNDTVTAITLAFLFLGTNLFWYSIYEATMSHSYSFALFSLFIFYTIKWYENQTFRNSIVVGILAGLITLVRPTNISIALFFVFYDVKSLKEGYERVLFFLKNYQKILSIIVFAFLVITPQLLYWKYVTDNWLYYSYGDKGSFFFNNPQILNGLFSYRKGWFIYTPIMFFAVLSIPLLCRTENLKRFFLPVALFLAVNVYVVLSWWSWWYGGSLGLRAFIESYSLLSLPLAALLAYILKLKKYIRFPSLSIVIVFALYGFFTNIKYYHGAIHWDSMTKEAYWFSFGKLKKHPSLDDYIRAPDYDKALKGIYVYQERPKTDIERIVYGDLMCDMETLDETGSHFLSTDGLVSFKDGGNQSNEKSRSGKYSVKVGPAAPFALAHKLGVMPNDTLYFEIWRSSKGPKDAGLVFSAQEPDKFYSRAISIGESDGDWDLIYQKLVIPNSYPDSLLLVYIWNPSKRVAYFDDYSMARAMERSNN